jgi:hypothetical protein
MGTSMVILEDPFQNLHLSHPGDPLIVHVWTGVCEKNIKVVRVLTYWAYNHVSYEGNIVVMMLATHGFVSSKCMPAQSINEKI